MTGSVIKTPPFGPVDLYLLGLPGELPNPDALSALTELTGSGLLRLLDLLLISRTTAGETRIVEAREIPGGFEIGDSGFGAAGLIGNEDVDSLAALIPNGTAALLVAVELAYQRELAEKTAASGADLLAYERIPAPVVNALLDSFVTEMES
jgi:hypothetical protein